MKLYAPHGSFETRLPSVLRMCGNSVPIRHGTGVFYRETIDMCLFGGTRCESNECFRYFYAQKDDRLFCVHGEFCGQYDVALRAFCQVKSRDADSIPIAEEEAMTIKRRMYVSGMVADAFAREPPHEQGVQAALWQYYAYFVMIEDSGWESSQCVLVRKAVRQSHRTNAPLGYFYELYNASTGFISCASTLIMCVEHQGCHCGCIKFSHVRDDEPPYCFTRSMDYQCKLKGGTFTHKISKIGAKWEVYEGYFEGYLPELGVWDDDPSLDAAIRHISAVKARQIAIALSVGEDGHVIRGLVDS